MGRPGIVMSDDVASSNGSKGRDSRGAIAFFIAPLAVPLLLLLWQLSAAHAALGLILTTMFIGAFVSYVGTLVFGIPAYRLLRARGVTALWVAVVVGFIIGILMWLIFAVFFGLSLGHGLSSIQSTLTNSNIFTDVMWPGGVLGAIVGAIFWLIARPDRQTH